MSKMSQAILVLGMHRSGTSALTGALGLLGVRLPAGQMEAQPDNPKGFFESEKIAAINDRILAALDTNWFGVGRIPAAWFRSAEAASFREELAAAVEMDYDDATLFVVKDPRICRLMPLWRQVFARIGVEPRFAITIRHPLEVAHSLEKRNGIPPAHGCILWLRHMLEVERETRTKPRIFIRYEDLLREPASTVKRVGIELGLGNLLRSKKRARDIAAFVDPDLRHHTAATYALEKPGALYQLWSQAFDAFIELSRSSVDGEAQWRLDQVRAIFERVMTSIDPADKGIWSNSYKIYEAFDAAMATAACGPEAAEFQVDKSMAKIPDFPPIDETATATGVDLVDADDAPQAALPAIMDARNEEKTLRMTSARLQAIQAKLASGPSHLNVVPTNSEISAANVERLNLLLRQRSARVGYLYAALTEHVAAVRKAQEILGYKDQEISGLRMDLAAAQARQVKDQLAITAREEELAAKRVQIAELQVKLTSASQAIEDLHGLVTAREEELTAKRVQIAELQAKLTSASQAIEDLRGLIVQKSVTSWGEAATHSREVEALRDEVASLSLHLADMRKDSELTRKAFVTSHSWRVTRPLRWFRRLFGG